MNDQEQITSILEFWFGPGNASDLPDEKCTMRWFGNNPQFDHLIKTQFETLVKLGAAGKLDHWITIPRGSLALIILLDQFSRNIYRGTARAFAQDEKALEVCMRALRLRQDQAVSLIERVFFYLPLEHAEDLTYQAMSVNAFKKLNEIAMTETKEVFTSFLDYAVEHFKVIEQFRRFPHRNKILGRESTAAEKIYLEQLDKSPV